MKTLEDFLKKGLTLVAFSPRYSKDPVAVLFSGSIADTGRLADAMTDGGDYISHIENMISGTPYFPFGTGESLDEAITDALKRFNDATEGFDEEVVDSALVQIHNAASNYVNNKYHERYVDVPALESLSEMARVDDESRLQGDQ